MAIEKDRLITASGGKDDEIVDRAGTDEPRSRLELDLASIDGSPETQNRVVSTPVTSGREAEHPLADAVGQARAKNIW